MRLRYCVKAFLIAGCFMTGMAAAQTAVESYLPAGWTDSTDLKSYLQNAFDNETYLRFNGSGDPYNILDYPSTTGLYVRQDSIVLMDATARLLRLPSASVFLIFEDNVEFSCDNWGAWRSSIDGNKAAHPLSLFPEQSRGAWGILLGNNCFVDKIDVYDMPGLAIGSHSEYNVVQRCSATNCGMIDLKYGVSYFSAAMGAYSADGFGFDGNYNQVTDCQTYDCQRWSYCSSHSDASFNVYTNCTSTNTAFRNYGIVDFESPANGNRFINCDSLTTANATDHIAISSENSWIEDCDLANSYFRYYNVLSNTTIKNCTGTYLKFGGHATRATTGTVNLIGAITLSGDFRIDEGDGLAFVQPSGTFTVGGDITDAFASSLFAGYPVYSVVQNAAVNLAGDMMLGYDPCGAADWSVSGGTLTFTGTGGRLTCGGAGQAALTIRDGGTIVSAAGQSNDMAIAASATSQGTLRGNGIIDLGGVLLNNGSIVADGYDDPCVLDLSGFTSVNAVFGTAGYPTERENTGANGYYAVNNGKLLLPTIAVTSGSPAVNWGENPADAAIDMVNSARLVFGSTSGGSLNIALLAADRTEMAVSTALGCWSVNYDGTINGAVFTVVYDAAAIPGGVDETDLRLYRKDTGGHWIDCTASIDTAANRISTVPLDALSDFIVATPATACGDPGTYLSTDISGPSGVPDCRVDLHDLAALEDISDLTLLAEQWLQCTDPGCLP